MDAFELLPCFYSCPCPCWGDILSFPFSLSLPTGTKIANKTKKKILILPNCTKTLENNIVVGVGL